MDISEALPQTFMHSYPCDGAKEAAKTTEDSVVFVINSVFNPGSPEGFHCLVQIIAGELVQYGSPTSDPEFVERVMPCLVRGCAIILHHMLMNTHATSTHLHAIQSARKWYYKFKILFDAMLCNIDQTIRNDTMDTDRVIAAYFEEQIKRFSDCATIVAPVLDMALPQQESSVPNKDRVAVGAHLKSALDLLAKVMDNEEYTKVTSTIIAAIVDYITGAADLKTLVALVPARKKQDREIVSSWNINDVLIYIDAAAVDKLRIAQQVLQAYIDKNPGVNTVTPNGYISPDNPVHIQPRRHINSVRGKSVRNWMARSLFYYIYSDICADEHVLDTRAVKQFVEDYNQVWGVDLPYTELGEQVCEVSKTLMSNYMIGVGMKNPNFLARNNLHGASAHAIQSQDNSCADFYSKLTYNFMIDTIPDSFNMYNIVRPKTVKGLYKKVYQDLKTNKLTQEMLTYANSSTARQMRQSSRFGNLIQELMPDGQFLIARDPALLGLDISNVSAQALRHTGKQ